MRFFTKILSAAIFVMAVVFASPVRADIASVRYIHQYVTKVWDITLPTVAADSNVASMKYLMSIVDRANEALNGAPTTDYAHDPARATSHIASHAAARDAVDKLIKKEKIGDEPVFWFVPASDGETFPLLIGAAGKYTVDWDDGEVEIIEIGQPFDFSAVSGAETLEDYAVVHTFKDGRPASAHKIGLGGHATDYLEAVLAGVGSFSTVSPAILFFSMALPDASVKEIDGCLGCVFSTLPDGRQPTFYATFAMSPITSVPEHLFDGISGAGATGMFMGTFMQSNISEVPPGMFDWVTDGAAGMFGIVFMDCSNLKTAPSFKNLKTGGEQMFYGAFMQSGIETVPDDMFASLTTGDNKMFEAAFVAQNLQNAPVFPKLKTGAPEMFSSAFAYSAIRTVPDDMFASLNGPYYGNMFYSMFWDCPMLTDTVKIGPDKLEVWEMWPDVDFMQYTYNYDNSLPNYNCIPRYWGGNGADNYIYQCRE